MAVTLKLPPELKERVSSVVEGTDKTSHAFMVEAIEQQTTLAERRKVFLAEAVAARDETLASGKGYVLEDIKAYYRALGAGRKAKRPRLKRWRG